MPNTPRHLRNPTATHGDLSTTLEHSMHMHKTFPRRPHATIQPAFAAMAAALAMATAAPAVAQSCHPSALKRDPKGSAAPTLVRIAGDFNLGEKRSRKVQLVAGQSYWFSAAGCPRTDQVELVVSGPQGQLLSIDGHVTGGCVKPAKTGTYTVTVWPRSLNGNYSWGSIQAEGAKSDCEAAPS